MPLKTKQSALIYKFPENKQTKPPDKLFIKI